MFIKLTTWYGMPFYVNAAAITSFHAEPQGKTVLRLDSKKSYPIDVKETPEEIMALIKKKNPPA